MQKYDDVLVPFLTLMRRELHANCGKGDRPGWLAMRPDEALLEVYYHLSKLQKAVKHNDGPAIQEYSADVANMAMMVLDICGGLAWVEPDSGIAHVTSPVQSEGLQAALPETMQLNYEPNNGRSFWHSDCTNHFGGVAREAALEETRSLMECLHCGKRGYYEHGWAGPHTVRVEPIAGLNSEPPRSDKAVLPADLHLSAPVEVVEVPPTLPEDDGGPESFAAQRPYRTLVNAWMRETFGAVEADNVGKTEFASYMRLALIAALVAQPPQAGQEVRTRLGKLRSTLWAIENSLDDGEMRQAAHDALEDDDELAAISGATTKEPK